MLAVLLPLIAKAAPAPAATAIPAMRYHLAFEWEVLVPGDALVTETDGGALVCDCWAEARKFGTLT